MAVAVYPTDKAAPEDQVLVDKKDKRRNKKQRAKENGRTKMVEKERSEQQKIETGKGETKAKDSVEKKSDAEKTQVAKSENKPQDPRPNFFIGTQMPMEIRDLLFLMQSFILDFKTLDISRYAVTSGEKFHSTLMVLHVKDKKDEEAAKKAFEAIRVDDLLKGVSLSLGRLSVFPGPIMVANLVNSGLKRVTDQLRESVAEAGFIVQRPKKDREIEKAEKRAQRNPEKKGKKSTLDAKKDASTNEGGAEEDACAEMVSAIDASATSLPFEVDDALTDMHLTLVKPRKKALKSFKKTVLGFQTSSDLLRHILSGLDTLHHQKKSTKEYEFKTDLSTFKDVFTKSDVLVADIEVPSPERALFWYKWRASLQRDIERIRKGNYVKLRSKKGAGKGSGEKSRAKTIKGDEKPAGEAVGKPAGEAVAVEKPVVESFERPVKKRPNQKKKENLVPKPVMDVFNALEKVAVFKIEFFLLCHMNATDNASGFYEILGEKPITLEFKIDPEILNYYKSVCLEIENAHSDPAWRANNILARVEAVENANIENLKKKQSRAEKGRGKKKGGEVVEQKKGSSKEKKNEPKKGKPIEDDAKLEKTSKRKRAREKQSNDKAVDRTDVEGKKENRTVRKGKGKKDNAEEVVKADAIEKKGISEEKKQKLKEKRKAHRLKKREEAKDKTEESSEATRTPPGKKETGIVKKGKGKKDNAEEVVKADAIEKKDISDERKQKLKEKRKAYRLKKREEAKGKTEENSEATRTPGGKKETGIVKKGRGKIENAEEAVKADAIEKRVISDEKKQKLKEKRERQKVNKLRNLEEAKTNEQPSEESKKPKGRGKKGKGSQEDVEKERKDEREKGEKKETAKKGKGKANRQKQKTDTQFEKKENQHEKNHSEKK